MLVDPDESGVDLGPGDRRWWTVVRFDSHVADDPT